MLILFKIYFIFYYLFFSFIFKIYYLKRSLLMTDSVHTFTRDILRSTRHIWHLTNKRDGFYGIYEFYRKNERVHEQFRSLLVRARCVFIIHIFTEKECISSKWNLMPTLQMLCCKRLIDQLINQNWLIRLDCTRYFSKNFSYCFVLSKFETRPRQVF